MLLRHPFDAIPSGRRRFVFVPLLVLTLSVLVALTIEGAGLQTDAAPLGIVSFELAGDAIVADSIVKSWDDLSRLKASFNLGLDFLYLTLYSTTIALACIWAADQLNAPWLKLLGRVLAWAQWAAALADTIENIGLLLFLFGTRGSFWPSTARQAAILKFTLVGLGMAYLLLGVVARLPSAYKAITALFATDRNYSA